MCRFQHSCLLRGKTIVTNPHSVSTINKYYRKTDVTLGESNQRPQDQQSSLRPFHQRQDQGS